MSMRICFHKHVSACRQTQLDARMDTNIHTHIHAHVDIYTYMHMQVNKTRSLSPYLAPHEHRPKDNLNSVKKIVADNDNSSSAGCPSFTWTDGFDDGRCCSQANKPIILTVIASCQSTVEHLTTY